MPALTKTQRLPQNIIQKLFQILFFVTPFLLSPKSFEVFELPKMLFVYSLTTWIVAVWIIRQIKEKRIIFQTTFLDLPLILFLISQIISTFISTDRHTSIYGYYSRLHGGLLSTVCYSLLYWSLVSNVSPQNIKKTILFPSFVSAFLISIYAILQHFGIDKNVWVQDVQNRVFSTLGQPNWLAAYLSVLIPFTFLPLFTSFKNRNKNQTVLYLTLLLSYVLALLFTKSKSGFLASVFSTSLFFIFYFIKNIRLKQKKELIGPLILSLSFLFLFLLIGTPYTPSLKNIINKSHPQEIQTPPEQVPLNITSSEDIRLIVWKGALNLWKKYPLFGTGTETFAYSYYWVRPKEHNLTSEWDFLYNKAHNEYLNFLATTGTVGLLTYLLIPLTLLLKVIKKTSLKNISLLSSYSTILITNFFGFSVVTVGLFFFLFPALLDRKENPKKSPSQNEKASIKNDLLIFLTIFLALKIFLSIISHYEADLNYQEAIKLRQIGQTQKAQEYIEKAMKLFPSEPNYYSEASLIYVQSGLEQKGKQEYIEKAIWASDQSVRISPTHPNLLKTRASLFYTLSATDPKYLDQLLQVMQITSQLAPTDAKTLYNLALTYQLAGETQKAKETLLKTIDLKANYDQAHFSLAQIYEQENDLKEAKHHYQQALDINPQNEKAKERLKTF